MEPRRYDYTLVRVEYPLERGYRMEARKLPDWIHLLVEEDNCGSKRVRVNSRIHVNKSVLLGNAWSSEFSDYEVIKDISGEIAHRWLN